MQSTHNILAKDQVWTFSGLDQHLNPFALDTTLPMDSADTLLRAGLISDPYYAQQELDCRWIGEREWKLTTAIFLRPEITKDLHSNRQYALLDLSWLDTHASIIINGTEISKTTNMFDRYIFDISTKIVEGDNQIEIVLHRADMLAKQRAETLAFPIPSSMGSNNTIEQMNLVRKVQCHAGWDWGITLMVSGIYKTPELHLCNSALPLYVTHKQTFLSNNKVELKVYAHIRVLTPSPVSVSFLLEGDAPYSKELPLPVGDHCVSHSFLLDNPTLWYPHGYGEAHLYTLSVEVAGRTLTQKIGIRQLHWLNTEDKKGKSMTLVVNGKSIFCKGANWIPSDAIPSRQEHKHRQLLEDALQANMNMLRVWGGGQYEHDKFYELCDELGILIWQDIMFACSLYPSEPWFLDEVKSELAHQIRRISHHPCIAIYCGDNEVIGALNWYEESKKFVQRYTVNYDRLNRCIAETISLYDSSRKFWPSSPSNGDIDFGDNWHDDTKGDMHYWDVWHSGESFDSYYRVQPRFCSEFGFQSFPSLPTINTFTEPSQHNITSPDMEHHQKNDRGNSIILEMFSRYFRIPSSFAQQVYLSQLQQSLAISLGIEYWRSTMPTCMGTLYWQLNDNWPVSSWSSIEYTGRWKQLHYHIARAYNPFLVTARLDQAQERIIISGINEQAAAAVQIEGGFYDFEGTCIKSISATYSVDEGSSTELAEYYLHEVPKNTQEMFVYFRYYSLDEHGTKIYLGEKCLFLCEPKKCNFPKVTLEYTVKYSSEQNHACNCANDATKECSCKHDAKKYMLTFSATKPVFYVFAEHKTLLGTFSDNSFMLMPNQKKTIVFQSHQTIATKDTAHSPESIKQEFSCYYLNSEN